VLKGDARTLRVHDYRGAQGGKKLAKLSVRRKRTSKRGESILSQVTVDKPSRPEDDPVTGVPSLKFKKMITMKTLSLALITILLLLFGSICPTQAQSGGTDQGIDAVEVVKATATVEKIDLKTRKVTLLLDDGKKKTYKVDDRVQNLAQVKVGDHLEMSFTEEIAIVVGKSNETPGAASAEQVSVAPNGAKPGVVMVETTAISAQILAVDAQNHRVTLLDPEGKKKTIKVSNKITNLNDLKVGETVDMLMTNSTVIEIVT
jgi:Cu/Ag efflux protein CusF